MLSINLKFFWKSLQNFNFVSFGEKHRKMLVLDIDETLVHSTFEEDGHADFFVDVI
jgi:TFIIF-interacting CTD phosphatase-like protein